MTASTLRGSAKIFGRERAKSLEFYRRGQTQEGLERLRKIRKAVETETQKLKAEENAERDAIIQRLVAEENCLFSLEKAGRQKKEQLRRFEKNIREQKRFGDRKRGEVRQYLKRPASSGRATFTGTVLDSVASSRTEWNDERSATPQLSPTDSKESRNEKCTSKRPDGVSDESSHEEEYRSTREGEAVKFHWRPKLSKTEQNSLRRALNMQKKWVEIGQPQRAAGRIHKGPSFKIKPEVIFFEDFEVDKSYTKVIEITNISLGFNTFRICPLPEEVQDVIDVEFAPPGRMSAGSTTSLKVVFKPTRNVKIESHLSILAPTGPEKFRLCCFPMKTVVQFSPPLTGATDFIQSVWREQNPVPSVATSERNKYGHRQLKRNTWDVEKSALTKSKQGEESTRAKVVVLDMGKFQLGAIGTRDLNLKNSGALGSQYVVLPIVTDVSNLQFPLPQVSADPSTGKNANLSPTSAGAEMKDSDLADVLGNDGFPSHDMEMDMMSGDRLILNESFSATHQQALSEMGFTELLDNWNYDIVNIHFLAVENYASTLKPHESVAVRFNYAPSESGNFYCIMLLKFKNPLVQDTFIVIKGTCLAPPLAIEYLEYSFNICVPDRCYRHFLAIQNYHDCVMKVSVAAPSPVKGELWFDPPGAFVQPQQKLIITASFSPKEDFLTRFPQFAEELDETLRQKHPGSMGFCIPVRFEGTDVILPVETALTGILTKKEIKLFPSTLDYGPCAEDSAVSLPITISNPSLLMAEYCFFGLPPAFSAYNALDPSDICNARYDSATGFYSPCLTSTPTSSSPLGVKRSDGASVLVSGTADVGKDSLTQCGGASNLAGDPATKTGAADSLLYIQSGVHGWVAPGDSHKCLIVYCPSKDSSDCSSGSAGARPEITAAGEKRYCLTLRILMGAQVAYEVSIPTRVLPTQTPLLFKPSAFLRLPAVPQSEMVTQSIVARLSLHAFSGGSRQPPAFLPSASTRGAQLKVATALSETGPSEEGDVDHWQSRAFPDFVLPSGGNASVPADLRSAGRLIVQILPPPNDLSCLTFNPTCFSLSRAQLSRRIAVSFSPNEGFMKSTENRGDKNVSGIGQAIGTEKSDSGGKTSPLSSAESSSQLGPAGGTGRVVGGSGEGATNESLPVQQMQLRAPKPVSSRPPSRAGEGTTAETTTTEAPLLRWAGENGGHVLLEEDGVTEEEEDFNRKILAYGGIRWYSATDFSVEDIAESEEGGDESDSVAGEGSSSGHLTKSRVRKTSNPKVVDGEPIIHTRWKIPVRWRWSITKQTAADEELCEQTSSPMSNGKDDWRLSFLEVATCATPPMISASSTVLDFGDVMVGMEARLGCLLRCTGLSAKASYGTDGKKRGQASAGAATHLLKAVELPLASCFALMRAIRPLTIENPLNLVVGFQPRAPQNYRTKLQLIGTQTRQTIELRGRGIEAELVITPPEQDLDFGAVMVPKGWTAGSGAQASLTPAGTSQYIYVRNPSSSCNVVFDVTRLAVSHPDVEEPGAGRPAATFACFPVKGIIPPGETQQLVFCFRPTRAEGMYTTVFQLSSQSGVQRPHILRLRGLAVAHQLYAAPYAAVCVNPDISNEAILSALPRAKSLWERPALQPSMAGASQNNTGPATVTATPPAVGNSALGRIASHTGKEPTGSHTSPIKLGQANPAQHAAADSSSSSNISGATPSVVDEGSYETYIEASTGVLDGYNLHGQVTELLFESEEGKKPVSASERTEALSGGAVNAVTREQEVTKQRMGTEDDAGSRAVGGMGSSGNLCSAAGETGAAAATTASTLKQQQHESQKKGEARETKVCPTQTCYLVVGAAHSPGPPKAHGKDSRGEGGTSSTNGAARDNGNQQQAMTSLSTVGGPSSGSATTVPIVGNVCPLSLSQQPLLSPYAKSKTETVGSFELMLEEGEHSSCFSVEPSRGSLTAGSVQIVQFTFNPNVYKASARTRALLAKVPALASVGQWMQATVKCTLRGGFSCPSAGSNSGNSNSSSSSSNAGGGAGGIIQEFTIVLKAYRHGPYY